MSSEYRKSTGRHVRAKVFLSLGLSGVLPVTHLLFSLGMYGALQELGFLWILAAGAIYITGVIL